MRKGEFEGGPAVSTKRPFDGRTLHTTLAGLARGSSCFLLYLHRVCVENSAQPARLHQVPLKGRSYSCPDFTTPPCITATKRERSSSTLMSASTSPIDDQHVGQLARLQRAELVAAAHDLRTRLRRAGDRLQRAEADVLHEEGQLLGVVAVGVPGEADGLRAEAPTAVEARTLPKSSPARREARRSGTMTSITTGRRARSRSRTGRKSSGSTAIN